MRGTVDCVVVGAGQAGLGVSRSLIERGIDHVVLERARIGETWRSQRWDSFRVNTPNRMNGLPDLDFDGDPDAFPTAAELAESFERYAAAFKLPVSTGVTVTAVEGSDDGFVVRTDHPDASTIATRSVVIASGPMRRPKIPAVAAAVPKDVAQVHAAAYRNPQSLPAGGVLVVGTAQSGCQIAEELLEAGRPVYLSASAVARAPRRYRGRDITGWLTDAGFMGMRPTDLPDPAMQRAAWPQVSGVGSRGHTVGLQWLAGRGAILVGRVRAVSGRTMTFEDSVAAAIRSGDAGSAMIKGMIDGYLLETGIQAPPPEHDPADVPCPHPEALAGPGELDLDAAGITSIVWCTGFDADFSWIHLPVVDERGEPLHQEGVSPVPGLCFIGLTWMRMRKSAIIAGVEDDAAFVADAVVTHLAGG
jgi:putative flavoprotein involved in K+ transport